MILGISGKLNSGKDETAKIIQYLTSRVNGNHSLAKDKSLSSFITYEEYSSGMRSDNYIESDWQVRKFAGKLKQIVALLTGCRVEDLEDQDFKKQFLNVDWDQFISTEPILENTISSFDLANKYGYNSYVIEKTHTSEARQKIKDECIAKAKKEGYELVRTLKPTFSDRYWIPLVEREQRTYRWMLQQIGTEAMRDCVHENVWVNALFADYKPINLNEIEFGISKYPNWLISDMRFPNEKKAIEDRGGITIRVNRTLYWYGTDKVTYKELQKLTFKDTGHYPDPDYVETNWEVKDNHPSETALDDATFSYVIDNDGTIDQLVEKVREILIKENLI